MNFDADSAVQAASSLPGDHALGLAHFVAQADAVGQGLLAVLLLMSALSWAVIVLKALTGWMQRRRSQRFVEHFWNAGSLAEVEVGLAHQAAGGPRDPYSQLTQQALQAQAHHARHGATRLAEAGSASEFVTRTLRKALDAETMRLENGLSLLATIGATAPFVGLFGTVWGVYHALLAIGSSAADGPGSLAQIAGPVGEALIMTGLGLAVAIPAVMAYNLYTRRNRVIAAQLDAFAGELHTFVTMGQPMGEAASETAVAPPPSTRTPVITAAASGTPARRSGPVAA
ncbi:MAG: MotA/TolQ/ExbB proton channel family protein [Burkholderiaceae bacterium]|nr:MotA/TolQ/ExbB proton channel family protein [Burkholderiaceae bacterium]